MTIDERIQIAREGKKRLQLTLYKAPCLEGVGGTVIKTGDDSFMVIINSDLPPQEQAAAFAHEMLHIYRQDFDWDLPVNTIERARHADTEKLEEIPAPL